MMQPFSTPKTTAALTSIVPALNKDTKVSIDNDTLARLYLVQQRAPEGTAWTGRATATEDGWHVDTIALFPQDPTNGPHLPPAMDGSALRVWVVKGNTFDPSTIPNDGLSMVMVISNNGLSCSLALPEANQILSNIAWTVTGHDPFAHLEAEIRTEMAAKVSKISYASTANNYYRGGSAAYPSSNYGASKAAPYTPPARSNVQPLQASKPGGHDPLYPYGNDWEF